MAALIMLLLLFASKNDDLVIVVWRHRRPARPARGEEAPIIIVVCDKDIRFRFVVAASLNVALTSQEDSSDRLTRAVRLHDRQK